MPENENNHSWLVWSKHVLAELKSHNNRLDEIDLKLDNHVTNIEHRLTKIETNYKNMKWILGLIFVVLVGILGTVLQANYIG